MKRAIILAGGLAACLSLSACSTLEGLSQPGGAGEKILQNLEGCQREYSGAIGAGVTGSFRIVCAPAVKPAPVADTATPPGGT